MSGSSCVELNTIGGGKSIGEGCDPLCASLKVDRVQELIKNLFLDDQPLMEQ